MTNLKAFPATCPNGHEVRPAFTVDELKAGQVEGTLQFGIVKLTKIRLTDPQDDGFDPGVSRTCWGAVSPILLNLTIPRESRYGIAV